MLTCKCDYCGIELTVEIDAIYGVPLLWGVIRRQGAKDKHICPDCLERIPDRRKSIPEDVMKRIERAISI